MRKKIVFAALFLLCYGTATVYGQTVAEKAYNSGDAALDQKNYDKAITEFTKVIKLEPSNSGAYHNRCLAYVNKKQYEKAITDCNQAIRFDPDYAYTYYVRGLAYVEKGDYDQAIENFSTVVNASVDSDAEARYNRGNVYANYKKDYKKAIED